MKNFKNKKTLQIVLLVVIAVVTLGVGYAAISAVNLIINGTATASVNQDNFKVHFTQAQSITGTTGVSGTSSIDSEDDTKAMFDVTGLTKVGDYAEAVYTVKNDSNGVGAEISLSVSNSNSEYFKVTEIILDNKLQAGEETTSKVRVEMIKTPIGDSISTSITATLTASPLENETATGGSSASVEPIPDPVSFSTDSWATIQKAVQNNNTSMYNIGDTKIVTINNTDYQVRIANKSTYDWCDDEKYSQTACGFVVEFAEIITMMPMNSHYNKTIGGYPATEVYSYLNNDLYEQLPLELQTVIKTTRVISGYCCLSGYSSSDNVCSNPDNNGNNYTSLNQNLYLLSGVEVIGIDSHDTAASTTTQLEYYQNSSNSALKKYRGTNETWTMRSPDIAYDDAFRYLYSGNSLNPSSNGSSYGISPAFRIG